MSDRNGRKRVGATGKGARDKTGTSETIQNRKSCAEDAVKEERSTLLLIETNKIHKNS